MDSYTTLLWSTELGDLREQSGRAAAFSLFHEAGDRVVLHTSSHFDAGVYGCMVSPVRFTMIRFCRCRFARGLLFHVNDSRMPRYVQSRLDLGQPGTGTSTHTFAELVASP